MQKRGVNVVHVSDAQPGQVAGGAEVAYPRVRGQLITPELFDEAKRLREEFRSRPATAP